MPRSVGSAAPAFAVAGSAALIVAPLLAPGYVLAYDMVFAPRMPLGADAVGLGSTLPRAVPSDLVVALLSHVLPGDLVQKLVLLGLVLLAGSGAARLAGGSPVARTAAALAYIWTPYLGERLLLGQWAVLVGWAALPWLLAVAARTDRPRGLSGLVLALGLVALAGAPAVLVTLVPVLVVLVSQRRWPAVVSALVATVVFALPWLLPGLLRPGGLGADPEGATVFAPRADTPLGRLLSVLTGGGVWNAATVPALRDAVLPALGTVLLLALGVAGALRRRDAVTRPLAVASGVLAVLVVVTAWPAGARALADLPGGSALRDSQRLVAPLVLLVALGFGALVEQVVARARASVRPAIALLALLPVAVLPSLAWGVSGRLHAVDYPRDYATVARLVAQRPGGVVVLPLQPYRAFGWNGGRTVLEPLPRILHRPTVASLDLPVLVGGRVVVVGGEDRLADRLGTASDLARAAAAAGVGWVVVDAPVPAAQVRGLDLVHRGRWLTLYRVPHVDASRADDPFGPYAAPTAPVVVGDLVALAVLLAAAGSSVGASVARLLVSRTVGTRDRGHRG